MEYTLDGKTTMEKYSFVLKDLLNRVPNRSINYRNFLYPSLIDWYITTEDKEIMKNVTTLRNNLKELILEKKRKIEKDASELETGDLMSILVNDELFKCNIEEIIDECLAFFMAGT